MQTEKISITELISPDYNPREITPAKMESLKQSLDEFGYVDPIIVNRVNNHIVGGNQRYEALKELGYTEIDVVFIEEPDLNREKALNIRLNNMSGEWDNDKLTEVLEELKINHFDIELTGLDEFVIEDLLFDIEDDLDEDYVDRSIEDAFNSIYEGLEENEKLKDGISDNRVISFYTSDEELFLKFLRFLGLSSLKLDKKRNIKLEDLECLNEWDTD